MNNPILFFDGICNLCNGTVKWVIKRLSANSKLTFAPLQGETSKKILHHIPNTSDSIVLSKADQIFQESDAALEIAKELKWPWRALYSLRIFPKGLRNRVYRWVARNRYRWFGKRESCMIPKPEWKNRFLP